MKDLIKHIYLADNQDISKAGLYFLFGQQADSYDIIEVITKKELIDNLLLFSDALVVLDYALFDFQSVNELLILEQRFPTVRWLLFSDELSDAFLRVLLISTKFFSVLMKDNSFDEIQTGIREIFRGNRYICTHVSNLLLGSSKISESHEPKQVLTQTEQEILKEIALGLSTKEVAQKRNVSVHTVMTHRKNIFRKIEVNNVHEATKYAMKAGLIDLAEYYI
jgi:DNA-binding NarL/FixJ family response regulator